MIKTSKSCDLNFANSGRDTEAKTSPRHLNFLKQLNKTTEMLYPKFGHSLRPQFFFFFFFSPRGGHGRRKILMDSHPYSHKTSIFTLGAPHEEVQGRQTKLHPGFTMGKLVQPSPGISVLRDAHIVLSNRS